MRRILMCSSVLASAFTFAGGAAADPNVEGLTLGVERVFGFTSVTTTDEAEAVTTTSSVVGFSLGNTASSAPLFTIPRVHVDYVLPMGLSFGGALGLRTMSFSNEVDAGPASVVTDSAATALLFAPRVGYMIGFNEHFGIWPRLGFSFVNLSSSDDDDDDDDDFSQSIGAFTMEAPFVFAPHKTFGFVAAPSLDLGVSVSREIGNDEYDGDLSYTEFGITLGLFVVL